MGNPQTYGVELQSVVRSAEVTFTEAGAGTYTGTIALPAGSTIIDIQVQSTALWTNGTSALMNVGDGGDPDGFYTAINLRATDLEIDEIIRFGSTGGKEGVYIVTSTGELNSYDPAARSVIGVVVAGAGAEATGVTKMLVLYVTPVSVAATKA